MNLIDLDRCCKLAELADSDITLTHKELRNMLDTINGLRNQRDELRARLDAQGQTPGRTIRYLDSDGKVFEEPDEPIAGTA